MGKYVVLLSDENGLSCSVSLSLPFFQNGTDPYNSSWQVLDEGFFVHRSGGCFMVDTSPGKIFTDGNLLLATGLNYGVILYEFAGKLGYANDSGSGLVHQPWALNCAPGQISWALL